MVSNFRRIATIFATLSSAIALSLPNLQNSGLATPALHNLSASELQLLISANNTIRPPDPAPYSNTINADPPSISNNVHYRCSYGHQLNYADCLDALSTFAFPPETTLMIGNRVSFRKWDLNLPVRWISGETRDLSNKTWCTN